MIRVGDLVFAHGQNEVVIVRSFSENPAMAEIQLFSVSTQQPIDYRMTVPRGVLSPFKEDASQAAARIVRDATQDR
jgi:hypothetical protein